MFGKIKKVLGIEDVKLQLLLDGENRKDSGLVKGHVKITSPRVSEIESIEIKLIELYARGRKSSKRIDEYTIAETILNDKMTIEANQIVEIPFELPFVISKSAVDKFSEKNVLYKGLAKLANWSRAVSSSYSVVATASVKGTRLNPFDQKELFRK